MIDTAITAHNVLVWSLLGGATKTHDDFKQKKVSGWALLKALLINSAYATMLGYMSVELWNFFLPTMGAIDFIVSFTAGFVGANIIAAIKNIDWPGLLSGALSRWIK